MTTDFRALCAELITSWDADGCDWKPHHQARWEATVTRARAALADQQRKSPTKHELFKLLLQSGGATQCVSIEWIEPFANAVLARWGRQPAPPADGEVAELVAWLRSTGEGQPCLSDEGYARLTRAAELLQRQAPVPVPVSERLPEPSTKVLAHYFNDLGRKRTICAIWVPAKSRSGDIGDDDDFTEYDEEDGKFYWPEGWYEAIENWDDLGWIHVDEGEVVYWQPLPKWPAHALPLPEVGE